MISKITQFISRHKKALIILALALGGYYYWQTTQTTAVVVPKYTLGSVSRDSLITTVSGTGQVSPSNQVPVKPTVNTQIEAVYVKVDQKVKKGDMLVQLDDRQLRIQANNARNSLAISQANLQQKLAGPTSQSAALAKNSVDQAQLSYNLSTQSLVNTQKTVQENLVKAKLALQNAQNQYNNTNASQSITSNSNSTALNSAYTGAKSSVNSADVAMRSAVNFADNLLNTQNFYLKNQLGILNSSVLTKAQYSLQASKDGLNAFENTYNSIQGDWSAAQTESMLTQALATAQVVRTLEHDLYSVMVNTSSSSDVPQATIDSNRNSASSQETAVLSAISSLQNSQQAISNAKLNVDSSGLSTSNSYNSAQTNLTTAQSNYNQAQLDAQRQLDAAKNDLANKQNALDNAKIQLDQLVAAPRSVDIAAMRLQVAQAQNSYEQALLNLAGAKVVAPIDGVVAVVNANVGDYANNGNSASAATALVTVVTSKQLATIALNEVDAAKVKVGQKVTVNFSAIDGLSMTGEVAEVDLVGSVTQGVVSYNIQVAFDTQDPRIKPQMSVSATIITNQKLDTLVVANSAVKTDNNGGSYVEVFADQNSLVKQTDGTYTSVNLPAQQAVVTGLANDTDTEILSGLKEGDQIVIKVTGAATAKAATGQQSGLNLLGGGGGRGIGGGGRGN